MLSINQMLRFGAAVFVVAGGLIVASCAGTPVATTPLTVPTATPTATAAATSNPLAAFPCGTAPASASGTVTNPTAGTQINFPALGACSSTITFSSGTTFGSGTSVNVTTSLAAPAGAPSPLPTNPGTGSSTPKTLLFETLTITAGSITVPAGNNTSPVQTVTVANTGTCVSYGQIFAAGGAWQGVSTGTVSGATVSFGAGQNSGSTTLNAAGSPYFIGYVCY